ncbi:hypothetical protein DGG96_07455 [Legionella qingyii]|uniref:Uncharacterized protein n=1 Tax=Legionella qingyii TaxID=2184757 RepID=A0A317U711_9GAMM|nr:hypothetical protein [Legionella qingyii]PWY56170.1 hypothetical protein DGG96_07455 [Legionella qingyii]RUR22198.1 hypothetical protein ELY20_09830 [Legionella qingyii]RUR25810.1 hypothetical protein ELY16_09170 [Legionella qingyii]
MYSKYDKLIYINLTQDQITANIDTLIIHETPAILVKIPNGSDLKILQGPEFFPGPITNQTKIYFSAHGREELQDLVLDRQKGDPNLYNLDDVATYFGKLLTNPNFKNPDITPRLTLVMCVCEGLGFAKNLQKKLLADYDLYIDVIANKNVLHEQFIKPSHERMVYLNHRETSVKGVGREYKRPHSKVLLTIDRGGSQQEIDAYELKWIENVLNGIHQQVATFNKWANFENPENFSILEGLITFCKDVDALVSLSIGKDIHLTANNLLALLQSCQKTSADPLYVQAMKFEMFQFVTKNLINEGVRYINPNMEMQEYLNALAELESQQNKMIRDEAAPNLFQAQKAIYSGLLAEASEYGIESVLDKLEQAMQSETLGMRPS